MPDKPLHVQVAEALGWTDCDPTLASGRWELTDPPDPPVVVGIGTSPEGRKSCIPHYDSDWSATGPLIEKYRLSVVAYAPSPYLTDPEDSARAWFPGGDDINNSTRDAYGTTPLIAVCNLILVLHKTDKLP